MHRIFECISRFLNWISGKRLFVGHLEDNVQRSHQFGLHQQLAEGVDALLAILQRDGHAPSATTPTISGAIPNSVDCRHAKKKKIFGSFP